MVRSRIMILLAISAPFGFVERDELRGVVGLFDDPRAIMPTVQERQER
jgi:hypothetical protein